MKTDLSENVSDFIVACELAEKWLARGDVLEVHYQVSDSFYNRVSVVDCVGQDVVLFDGKLG